MTKDWEVFLDKLEETRQEVSCLVSCDNEDLDSNIDYSVSMLEIYKDKINSLIVELEKPVFEMIDRHKAIYRKEIEDLFYLEKYKMDKKVKDMARQYVLDYNPNDPSLSVAGNSGIPYVYKRNVKSMVTEFLFQPPFIKTDKKYKTDIVNEVFSKWSCWQFVKDFREILDSKIITHGHNG